MKPFVPLTAVLLPLSFGLLSLIGCAKSPSGGATNNTPNRFRVTLSLAQTLNPNFYYAVAFDDVSGDGTGPNAIVSNSPAGLLNGVMGGNWRVLVRYHLGQFQVFYRDTPSDLTTERQILGTSLFVNTPTATSNALNFTLNLDAQVGSGTYFFPHTSGATPTLDTDRFDINFVTTSTVFNSAQDNRIKPVDAYGPSTTSTPFEFLVTSTRTLNLPDDPSDENLGIDPSFASVPFGQLDVTQLALGVTRG